jgi:uncharacterized protein with PIN domain
MRLRRNQMARLGRLLEMRYRPSELAAEIGCHLDTVYKSFIPAGCPHERDERGHIWIVGTEFAKWAREKSTHQHIKLADGEAYCLKCNKPVKMKGEITIKPTNRYLELMTGRCPQCNSVVNRARARRLKQECGPNDQSK